LAIVARFFLVLGYTSEHQLDTLKTHIAMNEAPKTTKEVTKKAKVESFDIARSDETLH
jgi:hypothetical protein